MEYKVARCASHIQNIDLATMKLKKRNLPNECMPWLLSSLCICQEVLKIGDLLHWWAFVDSLTHTTVSLIWWCLLFNIDVLVSDSFTGCDWTGNTSTPHTNCCSESNPCGLSEGHCITDGDCLGDLSCGTNKCLPPFPSNFVNCCYNPLRSK